MRFIAFFGLTLLMALAVAPGTAAEESWDSFVAGMGDYDSTLALSEQFAAILAEDDAKGLDKLARHVRDALEEHDLALIDEGIGRASNPHISETDYFEQLVPQVVDVALFPDESATRAALENLGSCEWAGIYLRNLILQVAEDGKEHRLDQGRLVIDDTSSDRLFALQFARCQLVRRKDWQPAAVGYHERACDARREPNCPQIADR